VRVRSITLGGFMNHTRTDFDLPETGVVLVTGPNGSGKSTLPEAVSVAGWNRTLRGTSPWQEGVKACAVVETERFVLSRSRSAKGAPKLSWQPLDGEEFEFQTSPLAQEALEREVGTWDVWRRTHVFSSQDAAHFTLASDGERKRLIESLLGIDRFDVALKACRDDQKKNALLVSSGERDQAVGQAKREGVETRRVEAEQRVADSEAAPEPVTTAADTKALREKGEKLAATLKATAADAGVVRVTLSALDKQEATIAADVRQVQQRAELFARDQCPTCEQHIPAEARQAAERLVADTASAAEAAREAAAQRRLEAGAELEELEEVAEGLRAQRETVQASLAAATAEARAAAQEHAAWERECQGRQRAEGVLEKAGDELAAIDKRLGEVAVELASAATEAAELAAAEQVLGLQGVRAQVLGEALGGIEAVANRWLAEIAGAGLALSLKPWTEKKTGGVNDKISLDVRGAGGGHGYKASSGGERRRVDVALLLALAEVAAAALGQEQGTLWFDEVFDTLDEEGVEAVTDALGKLSQDRAVVVISHSRALVSKLQPAMRIRMDAGTADVRSA